MNPELDLLKSCSLFWNMEDDEIDRICQTARDITVVKLPKYECMTAQKGIYIIVSGKIRVCKKEKDRELFLKYLMPGDSFGYSLLFTSSDFKNPTLLVAKERTCAIFIPEETIKELIYSHPAFAMNLISVQCEKIRFLNKKIDSFTSPTVEDRLFKFLKTCKTSEKGEILFEESMAELARKLDMGRASLYRAFDTLEKNGSIKKEDGLFFFSKKQGDEE